MKKIFKKRLIWSLIALQVFAFGCESDFVVENPETFTQFYMPQSRTGTNNKTLVMIDSVQSVVFGAAYGGPYAINEPISVRFEVREDLVDKFNSDNGTNYDKIPSESYEIQTLEGVIPSGEFSTTPLKININPRNGFDFETSYLLPISIVDISSPFQINESKRVTYFLVEANPPVYQPFNRSNWSVIDVSSEELVGEGANNGNAIHALDGAIGTFWHTKWSGGTDPMPHHMTIDMGEVKTVNGFSFIQRQNRSNGNVRNISIELSEDGTTWVEGSIFPSLLPSNNANNPIFLRSTIEARYFRVNIESTYGDTQFTHLSEIYAF